MQDRRTAQRSGPILKSSTPTKKVLSKKAQAQKEALEKQRKKDKILFSSIIIIIIIAVIVLYFVFDGRSPVTDVAVPPVKDVGKTGDVPQAGLPQDVQMVLSKAKLKLESIDNKDVVKVVIEKSLGKDGNEIAYKYDWSINGQPAGNGSDSMSGTFKRGDKMAVKVTPFDGEKAGQARVLEFSVQNSPPHAMEDKQFKYDGKSFSYQIKGKDPDGDELVYSLEEAPQGMTIDPKTGVITWQLKEEDYGQHTIKVKIADGKGGTTLYPAKIDLPKPAEQKKTAENKK